MVVREPKVVLVLVDDGRDPVRGRDQGVGERPQVLQLTAVLNATNDAKDLDGHVGAKLRAVQEDARLRVHRWLRIDGPEANVAVSIVVARDAVEVEHVVKTPGLEGARPEAITDGLVNIQDHEGVLLAPAGGVEPRHAMAIPRQIITRRTDILALKKKGRGFKLKRGMNGRHTVGSIPSFLADQSIPETAAATFQTTTYPRRRGEARPSAADMCTGTSSRSRRSDRSRSLQ